MYRIWDNMIARCNRESCKSYKNYGGRGIKVDPTWLKYANFHSDMVDTYQDGLTLDRIDNNGNYTKENCRWVDYHTQARNKSNSLFITINGETKIFKDWCDHYGIPTSTAEKRMKQAGKTGEDIFKPVENPNWNSKNNLLITINGETKCLAEWAKYYGVPYGRVLSRRRIGWPLDEKLFTTPPKYNSKTT